MDIATPKELTLTDVSAPTAGCCGGGGCGCDSGAGATKAAASASSAPSVREDFLVTGMTCGHCVASVTEELSAVSGVASVAVALDAGGTSVVTVESSAPLQIDAVRAAVEEAGYGLVTPAR
jgi:copper chaperone CopZ